MKRRKQVLLALLTAGLLSAAVIGRRAVPPPPPPPIPAALLPPSRPATPFERSLRQGWKLRSRALLAEIRKREALERWDPTVATRREGGLRSEYLARDDSGDLRRARAAAREAAALAQTPTEARRAAALLALIERDLPSRGRASARSVTSGDGGGSIRNRAAQ